MKKIPWLLCLLTAFAATAFPNPALPTGWWRASLLRKDGNTIDFNVSMQYKKGKPVWYIRNASEKIEVTAIEQKQDSILVQMPLFESEFRLQYTQQYLTGRVDQKNGHCNSDNAGFVHTRSNHSDIRWPNKPNEK